MKGDDGYYDIHTANADSSNDSCVTCNLQPLTQKHIAAMAWHPSGKWLITVIEKASHPGSSFDALPGFGAYSDIWVIDSRQQNISDLQIFLVIMIMVLLFQNFRTMELK